MTTIKKKLEKAKQVFDEATTFILTDFCMWENNKQAGTGRPHAVQVIDEKTGQTRFIKSGSRIKFVFGDITDVAGQEQYNKEQELPTPKKKSKTTKR